MVQVSSVAGAYVNTIWQIAAANRLIVGASSTTRAGDTDTDRSSSIALVSSIAAKESNAPDSSNLHVGVMPGAAKRFLTYFRMVISVSRTTAAKPRERYVRLRPSTPSGSRRFDDDDIVLVESPLS